MEISNVNMIKFDAHAPAGHVVSFSAKVSHAVFCKQTEKVRFFF